MDKQKTVDPLERMTQSPHNDSPQLSRRALLAVMGTGAFASAAAFPLETLANQDAGIAVPNARGGGTDLTAMSATRFKCHRGRARYNRACT